MERSPRFVETKASVWLDVLRSLAALLVLGEHWRNMFFADFHQLTLHQRLFAGPYLLTSAGHQAVVIFFVLSGYLICGSIVRSLERGNWSWTSYLTHRFVRLWLVLLPGLLLCVLWDRLGLWLNRFPMLYCGDDLNHLGICVRDTLSLRVFFGNLFFLQTIRVPTLGSDIALWSLAYEFWYYLLFPLGLLMIVGRRSVKTRASYAVVFAAMLFLVGSVVGILFPVWLLGAALVFVPPPKVGRRMRGLCCVLYVPIVFLLAKERSFSVAIADDLLGCATFLLVWVLLSAREKADPQAINVRFWRSMSRFSFTLYVVHMPFLLFVASLSVGTTRWIPDARHLGWGLGILGLALIFALAVAWATEFRTDTVRRWFERRLQVWQTRFGASREGIRVDS